MKVWPKDDNVRSYVKHPVAGAFRSEGPMDWPNDSYTNRLIRDGALTTEPEEDHANKARKAKDKSEE